MWEEHGVKKILKKNKGREENWKEGERDLDRYVCVLYKKVSYQTINLNRYLLYLSNYTTENSDYGK